MIYRRSELSQTDDKLAWTEQGTATFWSEDEREKEEATQTEFLEHAKVEFGTQTELFNLRFDIERFQEKASDVAFYTRFPNSKTLMLCYDLVKDSARNISYGGYERNFGCPALLQPTRPRALTTPQEFILVLMQLRLGLFEKDLAQRFRIAESTISIIIFSNIDSVSTTWITGGTGCCSTKGCTAVLQEHVPTLFKELYPNTVLIIDCTEVQMERPSALDNQSSCYSSYKSRRTMKVLVRITPSGVIGFVDELYPGSITDKEIS